MKIQNIELKIKSIHDIRKYVYLYLTGTVSTLEKKVSELTEQYKISLEQGKKETQPTPTIKQEKETAAKTNLTKEKPTNND